MKQIKQSKQKNPTNHKSVVTDVKNVAFSKDYK